MKRKIAVIPGDGIGPEVTREGVRVLDAVNERHGLGLEFVEFDWGAETYLKTGVSLPAGALDDLRSNYAAVYLGAIGDPSVRELPPVQRRVVPASAAGNSENARRSEALVETK